MKYCVLCVDGYIARLRKTESDEQASQNVTEGLMELRQIMQGQLQHSHNTMEVLGEGGLASYPSPLSPLDSCLAIM